MVNEYILDAKDEAIINGLDNLFGVVQNKEVLRNIIIFSKLKRDDEINTGNFNIIIRNNSDYNLLEDFLRICTKLFVKNNIIENDKIYFLGENEDKCKGRKNNDIWNFVALIANLSTLNKQTANPTISTPSAIER